MAKLGEIIEEILQQSGGFGRFQIFTIFTVLLSMICTSWSMLMMAITGAFPPWLCVYGDENENNVTDRYMNQTTMTFDMNNTVMMGCSPPGNSSDGVCKKRIFDEKMNTVVSEVSLKLLHKLLQITRQIGDSLVAWSNTGLGITVPLSI